MYQSNWVVKQSVIWRETKNLAQHNNLCSVLVENKLVCVHSDMHGTRRCGTKWLIILITLVVSCKLVSSYIISNWILPISIFLSATREKVFQILLLFDYSWAMYLGNNPFTGHKPFVFSVSNNSVGNSYLVCIIYVCKYACMLSTYTYMHIQQHVLHGVWPGIDWYSKKRYYW